MMGEGRQRISLHRPGESRGRGRGFLHGRGGDERSIGRILTLKRGKVKEKMERA